MQSEAQSKSEKIVSVEIGSLEPRFRKLEPRIGSIARGLLRETGNKKASFRVYLVGDKTMKKNVLSFPAPKKFPHPDALGTYLGEVYLNPDYIKEHDENLGYMLVHGFLHLLGYIHGRKDARIAMERRERLLMKKLNLAS